MAAFYAPYTYMGDGQWLKHHVLVLDSAGVLVSVHPFENETAQTLAYQDWLMPAFSPTGQSGHSLEAALEWLVEQLKEDGELTLPRCLQRAHEEPKLSVGNKVVLWQLTGVDLTTFRLLPDAHLQQVYP